MAAVVLLGASSLVPAAGQTIDAPHAVRDVAPQARLDGAVRLIRSGRPAEAVPLLHPLLEARPGYRHPAHGAAAFWLGAALDTIGRARAARSVRANGLQALDAAGAFDLRLAEAYLRDLTPRSLPDQRSLAVRTYTQLLNHVGPADSAAVRSIFRREMAQLAPLLPDDVFDRVVDADRSSDPETWTFRAGAGAALLRWWRRLDPMPSTSENERVEEHLSRRVQARRSYACADRLSGLDARGIAHLRLGAPWKTTTLRYNDPDFFKEVFRFGVAVSGSDFPTATLWLYTDIDRDGYFLFAEKPGGCFATARANDLLPPHLKHYRGTSKRGLNIAYSAMMAMRYIYEKLSLHHSDFATRYNQIAEYADVQEMRAARAEVARTFGKPELAKNPGERQVVVGAGATKRVITYNPLFGEEPPTDHVNRIFQEAARADRAAAKRRKAALPPQRTTVRADLPALPVAARTARFLTPDGHTRAEVTWGVRMQDVASTDSAAAHLIVFSAVRYDSTYRRAHTATRRVRITASGGSGGRAVVPAPVSLSATDALNHVRLQWNHYPLRTRGRQATAGAQRHMAVARADSLAPLRPSGPLAMSDLQVLTPPDTTASVPTQIAQAVPYPFSTIRADTPLLLGFELYHLAVADNDQTRYTVRYEVQGRGRRSWMQPFRSRTVNWTSTATTASGTRSRTEEKILLDLSRLSSRAAQDVRVTVRVTDEVTGATAARSVAFVIGGDP